MLLIFNINIVSLFFKKKEKQTPHRPTLILGPRNIYHAKRDHDASDILVRCQLALVISYKTKL
jgi:hypothetical protein